GLSWPSLAFAPNSLSGTRPSTFRPTSIMAMSFSMAVMMPFTTEPSTADSAPKDSSRRLAKSSRDGLNDDIEPPEKPSWGWRRRVSVAYGLPASGPSGDQCRWAAFPAQKCGQTGYKCGEYRLIQKDRAAYIP